MTLDEAIKMCENDFTFSSEEYEQLAEWLEELKAYQQQHIALCEKYDVNTVEEIYVKAIDDFVKKKYLKAIKDIGELQDMNMEKLFLKQCLMILEQLN